jgi:hypothetical protein
MQRKALLYYCMVSLICHNIRSILHLLFKPMGLVSIGVLTLYYLGILQLAIRQCRVSLTTTIERIWVLSMKLQRRFYESHRKYTRASDQHEGAVPYDYARLGPLEIRLVVLCRSHPLAKTGCSPADILSAKRTALRCNIVYLGRCHNNLFSFDQWLLLPVTRNASEALHAAAPLCGSKLVWIDSICINQQDPLDKKPTGCTHGRDLSTSHADSCMAGRFTQRRIGRSAAWPATPG